MPQASQKHHFSLSFKWAYGAKTWWKRTGVTPHLICYTSVCLLPSLHQSKEEEIISDSRPSNLPLASCFILGTPVAHMLCRLLRWTKKQHRALQGVIQRNKTEANTCSSVSMQAKEKAAISSSSIPAPGSDHHCPSSVPSRHCFTSIHLTHISGYILEKSRTSNGCQGLCHLRPLISSRRFALGGKKGREVLSFGERSSHERFWTVVRQ